MKLVEILARELKAWPNGHYALTQWKRNCEITGDDGRILDIRLSELSEDYLSVYVTRAQWEEERARIAANQQATQEAREIARTGSMNIKEKELADIACGKRSNEDQELWDKVALASTQAFITGHIAHFGHENVWQDTELISCAADYADAFMAERAKRMKG